MRLSIVIMASGYGKRYGSNKLLEEFRGRPLFSYALETAARSDADSITVVTRFREIEQEIHSKYPKDMFRVVKNYHPERGISESLRLGLEAEEESDGCCFMVCDQPLLKKETVDLLFNNFRKNQNQIYLCGDGLRRGNPVLFPKEFFPELLQLRGDSGGKQIIKKYPDRVSEVLVRDKTELYDIDSVEDKQKLLS